MNEDTPLVTCIIPHNIENQKLAIVSWLQLGFSVYSLNTQSEIDVLKTHFAGVEFIAVLSGADVQDGHCPASLTNVIGLLESRGASVCGLIKSDIHLSATPASLRFVMEAARNSLVFASRADVDSLDVAVGSICKSGFDFFLFDRAILKLLPVTELCLGQPWWDLWLPYCLVKQPGHFPLKFVSYPFARHVITTKSCEEGSDFERNGLLFAKFLDQGAHAALSTQPPEVLRASLATMGLNVAMAILFESQWLSCFPE